MLKTDIIREIISQHSRLSNASEIYFVIYFAEFFNENSSEKAESKYALIKKREETPAWSDSRYDFKSPPKGLSKNKKSAGGNSLRRHGRLT